LVSFTSWPPTRQTPSLPSASRAESSSEAADVDAAGVEAGEADVIASAARTAVVVVTGISRTTVVGSRSGSMPL